MKKRSLTIKWKIFSYLTGFCLLLVGILWLFQIVFLDDFYQRIKQSQVQRDAASIAEYIREGRWDTLTGMLRSRSELYVEVWTPEKGTVLVTSGSFPDAIQSRLTHWGKTLLFDRIRRNGSMVDRFSYEEAQFGRGSKLVESILCAEILETADGQQHLLMVSANLSPVSATVDTLRIQLLLISGVMLLLSVLIALLLSWRVSAPMEKLERAAARLGRGEYDVKFDGKGYREISQLADTLTQAARELGKTESLRRELIANLSHDLRTPLTLITGYGEMMRDIPGENNAENIQLIVEESKRLTGLVSDLLDLSRLQSDMAGLEMAEASLTACVGRIMDRLAQFCEKDGYTLGFEQEGEAVVMMDEGRISQVIYNLITNALTYTGDDRRVTVRQLVEGGRVRIAVEDTGPGIPEEELPFIWDRYYRAGDNNNQRHRRAAVGAGLGLSIVRSVLEAHPGVEYGAFSRMGAGSVFWFSLPLVTEEHKGQGTPKE